MEAAHLLGDRDTAADLGRMLRPYAALPFSPSLAVTCFGPVHHALGVAALTTGDLDAAVLELGSAVARSLALGHLPAAALAGHRLAQALRSRGRPADVSMARDVAAESAARAERIGMALPDPREPVAGRGRQPASAAGPICASGPDRAGVGIVRCGRRWSVTTPVAEAEVDDCVGLRYLAVLVSRPGTEVSALELASATDPAGWADRYSDTPHEVVDRRTLTLYRHRLAELDEQIAEHEAAGDDRAQQCRTEREWIRAELRRVVGVGGRPRCFVTDAERARVSVTKAIARALARIALVDAAVADHLRARVRTGVRCTFTESGVTAVPPVSPAPALWAG
ncbi:LuxR family transcriptional regulator (fragment) [Nostocoides japonicum T1-X7]|uniref:LuxR family transcriptional regulator n=1 Tax=Nostocoides japonicum T1-X7 TaxID=1194083 RepID=A0A077LXM3_9MICO